MYVSLYMKYDIIVKLRNNLIMYLQNKLRQLEHTSVKENIIIDAQSHM